MNSKNSKFQIDHGSIKQEIIHIRSFKNSEELKCGIRELITSYRKKGWVSN